MAYKKLKLWFDEALAQMLADKIKSVQDSFNDRAFIQAVKEGVDDLELKDRVELMADALHEALGGRFVQNAAVLLQILGPKNEEETGMFTNYYWIMPIAKYAEKHGLDDFEQSMELIREVTMRNTSEYAIRPFLEMYPAETLAQMQQWTQHPNKHVRRLASEGVRPRLPWASKLQPFIDDPTPILPILEALKDDPSKYVQKSVANCINDILKDNLSIGQTLIEQWTEDPTPQRKWIIKHAIRNFRKKEDPWALGIIA
jgi:3-methyladenine DNA glycosylase AlkC